MHTTSLQNLEDHCSMASMDTVDNLVKMGTLFYSCTRRLRSQDLLAGFWILCQFAGVTSFYWDSYLCEAFVEEILAFEHKRSVEITPGLRLKFQSKTLEFVGFRDRAA
jgi:hypothetical protein